MPRASAIREVATKPTLGPPAYVVLGMIGLGARSGYEIKQMVELSIRFFWTISQAQIYPSLETLERVGLISGRAEPRGKRPRRVYDITEQGNAELERWLSDDEPIPFELRDIALVKLFFAEAMDREQALALLVRVKERSEQQIVTLRHIEPAAELVDQQGNPSPLLTLRMGVAFHQAMIDVCAEFEPKFHARP
ncbi:MAG TPA: PadR family transcriptional regulator [Solirubrobacteraceae bacterium]|nr:PadR family transcriptional regulator [Solirubrobacteraceae bacterium]